jgi:membrane-bound ClpP family serine protease
VILNLFGAAVGIGLGVGLVIIILILIQRRHQRVNSLISIEDCIGLPGTIVIPLNPKSLGKIRLTLNHSTLILPAATQEQRQFQIGDRVLVVDVQGKQVWVVSDETTDYPF